MSNSETNSKVGIQLQQGVLPGQNGLLPAVASGQSMVSPVITYNIICNNQPDNMLAKNNNVANQTVLAEIPFQVNAEVVYTEEELFKKMYDRIVSKLEADKDASSAGKKK